MADSDLSPIFDSPEEEQAFYDEFLAEQREKAQWVAPALEEFDPTAEDGEEVNKDAAPPKRVSTDSARRAYFRIPELPEGFQIHHLCHNPWCRNPDHLIAVSPADHQKIHGKRSYCER